MTASTAAQAALDGPPEEGVRRQKMGKILILMIRCYQAWLSPLFSGCCRFEPSCSTYFIEAVSRHGAWAGLRLGLRRIARCHPLSTGGFDPVPSPEPAARPNHGDTL